MGGALAALVFGLPLALIFRWFFEREFAVQIVTVNAGGITWARKTKFWTRTRHLSAGEVTGIATSAEWGGFGSVCITTRRRRCIVLDQLLTEDAAQFAGELGCVFG